MLFDIKMDGFRHKAMLGRRAYDQDTSYYYICQCCVKRDSQNHSDDHCSSDILNDYVQAPVAKKVLTAVGPEFQSDASVTPVIAQALFGLKSALEQFARCMKSLG